MRAGRKGRARRLLTAAAWCLGAAALALLLLLIAGAFAERIEPGPPAEVLGRAAGERVIDVASRETPVFESAVGTIRAVSATRVGSKILARVATMHVEKAGQACEAGEVLAELAAQDLDARARGAGAALAAAKAALVQARADLDRGEKLLDEGLASRERRDRYRTAFERAQALVTSREQELAGARTALSYATIRAPISGVVVDKLVDEGDLVTPGKVLFEIYDPTRLQLVASVREGLAGTLEVGQSVDVRIDAVRKTCTGRVDQIVPAAQSRSRSFEVKVTGPCAPGVVSGMFGRLLVPRGTRREIRVPLRALRRTGQLDTVFVVLREGGVLRRFVRTGATHGDEIEVLAGLAPGERILAEARRLRAK